MLAEATARRAAEEVAGFKAQFLRHIGHEIGNPMQPLKVHLALLRRSSGELLERRPSNRGPTGRDSRSSSRQSSKRGRFAQDPGSGPKL